MIVKFAIKETVERENISILELSNRSENALKRAGITEVGEIIDRWDDVSKIRGMGATSIKDIVDKLMDLVIKEMTDKQLQDFWFALIKDNSVEDLKLIFKK